MTDRQGSVVSWQQAEDALIEAVEYLAALPDRDRAFLSAGSRSCWPQIVRSARDGDYGDGQHIGAEIAPSARLTRRMQDRLHRVLLDEDAAAMAILPDHRALVGRVLVMKRWPGPDGFRWDNVWRAEARRAGGKLTVTSDALRRRYERAVSRVAARMGKLGLGAGLDGAVAA